MLKQILPALNSFFYRNLFMLGMLTFLLAKFYLVIPTTFALATTRLGDDSLVYLWKGRAAFDSNIQTKSAIQDIIQQSALIDNASNEVLWMRSNVLMRTTGNLTPSYNLISQAALYITSDLRWAFALTEVIGILTMLWGLAWILYLIVGPQAAGIALIPLAFAILPNQGIYSFIPSTLALSCSLVLWSYVWKYNYKLNYPLTLISAIFILGIHPISKVYIIITPLVYLISVYKINFDLRVIIKISLLCLLSIIIATVIPKTIEYFYPPNVSILGSISLTQGFSYNFFYAYSLLIDPIIRKNLFWFILFLSSLLINFKFYLTYPFSIILLGILLLLFSSFIFILPKYPAELFTRFFVLGFIIITAISAKSILEKKNKHIKSRKIIKKTLVIAYIGSILFWTTQYVPHTMNLRDEIVSEQDIKDEINQIPNGSTIIYAEAQTVLQAALLLGADRLGAIIHPMLANTNSLDQWFVKKNPIFILALADKNLNSLAKAGSKSFTPRRMGFYLPEISKITLEPTLNNTLEELWLRTESCTYENNKILWEAFDKNHNTIQKSYSLIKKDILIKPPTKTYKINITLPDAKCWITGIKNTSNFNKVFWPWENDWKLMYFLRKKPHKPPIIIHFNIISLLKSSNAEELIKYVANHDSIYSDKGGFVFIKTKNTFSNFNK